MASARDDLALTARWLFSATGPPLPGGVLVIRSGRIAAVEAAGRRRPDLDLGNCAIIPGLVNAHTHLDLTGMQGVAPPTPDFLGWLRRVIAFRQERAAAATRADLDAGLRQALRLGTTLLGDISAHGASWAKLAEAPIWSICFRELIGLSETRVPVVWRELVDWMAAHPDTPTCRTGVSPHAPYSVHRSLIEASARLWPVAIHLAEAPAELTLLERRTGPFEPFLRDLGVWNPRGLAPSVEWVLWRAGRAPVALFAHGNYLPPTATVPTHAAVVYCPRTHAAFGHAPYPLQAMLKRGIRVALGTDSLASNPDLDVLAEAAFVRRRHPDVAPEVILRMATLHGAEALGFEDLTGSLEPGKSADWVAITLPDRDERDPYELLFAAAEMGLPRRRAWRGRWDEEYESARVCSPRSPA